MRRNIYSNQWMNSKNDPFWKGVKSFVEVSTFEKEEEKNDGE